MSERFRRATRRAASSESPGRLRPPRQKLKLATDQVAYEFSATPTSSRCGRGAATRSPFQGGTRVDGFAHRPGLRRADRGPPTVTRGAREVVRHVHEAVEG